MIHERLPNGWKTQSLIKLIGDNNLFVDGDWVESKDQNPDGDVRLIQLADIGDGYFGNRSNRFLTFEKALELRCTFLEKGDVLVARMPDPLGRACIFPGDHKKSVTVVDVCIIRTNEVNHLWLMHCLNSPQIRSTMDSLKSGSTRKRISRSNLAKIIIPIPPIKEQERIVAKIEEVFTQLDVGTAALKRVQTGLKRYKASVLKAAVEGRLVDSGIRQLDDGELPEGWKWVELKNLAANEPYSITDGPFGSKLKTEHYTKIGPRVIRLQNIGDIEFRDEKAHISPEHFNTLKKHQVFGGELVIAGLGQSLPRACMIPEFVGEAIVKADSFRYKPNSKLANSKYLLFALNSEPVKKMVAKVVHGIGRPRMNQREIKAIPIPLPPFDEQQKIVNEVELRISVVQEVEEEVSAGLARAERLRQSVLKSAIEGRLV